MTDSELVRLSPVTQHRQTVIGCEQMDGWLRIWGFFDYGHAWVQHFAGDPPAVPIQLADFPPDCLTITIEGPGALTISQGRTGLVRLRDGRVIFPQEDLFQSVQNPLGRFFRQLIDDLLKSTQRRDLSASAEESVGQRTLLNIYTTSILAIVERIRLTQHGGSVVISRTPFNEQLAHVTYTVSEHAGLADEIIAYKTLDDLLREPHCRVWLSPPPFDHSKLMVVDGLWSLAGSANWDPRSLRLNFEFNLECYSRELAASLTDLARSKLQHSRPVTLADVDGRRLPVRLRDGVARLLSPYL